MKETKIFDTPALATQFYVTRGGFGAITQTLRGAVQHCDIESQDDFVWVVEVEVALDETPVTFPNTQFDDDDYEPGPDERTEESSCFQCQNLYSECTCAKWGIDR